ncbi:MAG: hypothetical protein H3C47_11480, partial [Candidatus Cloacimonetes bacterium]|nr:hypothetical protein [Candidatus Cloacimonadota bacterium]
MQNLNLKEAQFILQILQDLNHNLEKILIRQLRTNDSLTEVGKFILGIGFDSFEIEVDYFYHKHHVCIGTSTETITMPVGVSDHEFGWCKVGVDGLLKQYSRHMVNVLASFMTEMADSLLYQSKMASIKQTLMERMRKEFMDPVFEDAVSKAISHLYEIVEFEDLVLVYRESISLDHPERLDYLIFYQGKLIHSQENPHKGMDKLLGVEGDSIFHWPLNRYREFVECQTLVQEKILSALDPELVLGTFVFSSNHEVTNFSRDVLKMFVNGIHEILNEYTREKQNLSCNFPGTVVRRLLRTPNYHRK